MPTAASPFETRGFATLLVVRSARAEPRVRPPGDTADFLILRASEASVSKDEEIPICDVR
jgi:hypothetical protein